MGKQSFRSNYQICKFFNNDIYLFFMFLGECYYAQNFKSRRGFGKFEEKCSKKTSFGGKLVNNIEKC